MAIVLLVTGGRDFRGAEPLYHELSSIHERDRIALIMTGACQTGADAMTEVWAKMNEIPYLGIPAEWNAHGRAAGPIRNRRMVSKPFGITVDRVLACPGGPGTNNMIATAKHHHIPVVMLKV